MFNARVEDCPNSDVEPEGSTTRPASSLRRSNPGQKRKAEEEARGREQAKITKQPQRQSSEPTTVVFVQALVSRYPAYRTIRGGNEQPEFLIIQRKDAPGIGKWSFPGGPLPPVKTIREAALQYLLVNGGLVRHAEGGEFRIFRAIDTFMADESTGKQQHLVTLFVLCGDEREYSPSTIFNPGPEHKYLDWSSIADLNPLFEPLASLIKETVKVEKTLLVDWKSEPGFSS